MSLVTFALHGVTGSLSRDLSVYTYAGQQVVDGHPPYLGILNRAGPLAHLCPALGVCIARIVGIDDLVGARLLFMAISVLCVCTAYLLGRDLFGSALVGLVTAATFLSFQGFIEYASNGPREKTPMMLFILLALWAMVHRRWFAAGLCVSLATLTLQIGFFAAAPAVLVALLLAPGEVGRIRALLRFVAGGLAPVLVFLGYFALVGALKEAVDAFLVLNFRYSTSNPLTDHIGSHVTKLKEGYGVTLWFMLVGLAALRRALVRDLLAEGSPRARVGRPGDGDGRGHRGRGVLDGARPRLLAGRLHRAPARRRGHRRPGRPRHRSAAPAAQVRERTRVGRSGDGAGAGLLGDRPQPRARGPAQRGHRRTGAAARGRHDRHDERPAAAGALGQEEPDALHDVHRWARPVHGRHLARRPAPVRPRPRPREPTLVAMGVPSRVWLKQR